VSRTLVRLPKEFFSWYQLGGWHRFERNVRASLLSFIRLGMTRHGQWQSRLVTALCDNLIANDADSERLPRLAGFTGTRGLCRAPTLVLQVHIFSGVHSTGRVPLPHLLCRARYLLGFVFQCHP
jgi:hypothetical protein